MTSVVADAASTTTPAQGSLDSAGAGITGGQYFIVFLLAPFFDVQSVGKEKPFFIYRVSVYLLCTVQPTLVCYPNLPHHHLTPYTGYTGSSLSLQIIIAFLLGLSLYNAIELIVLALVTFQRYQGLYFWSLLASAGGIIPYSLGFIVKFFRLLDPDRDEGYVAVVLLTVGWWGMVSGK